jgi:hypothetical protein
VAAPNSLDTPDLPAFFGRPHDHHRAVRTRRNSALPAKPTTPSDQHRYFMIPSLPINNHCHSFSCWLAARRAGARTHTSICRELHSQSSRATNRAPICTGLFILTKAQKYLCSHRVPRSSASLACPNLHSLLAAPPSRGAAFPLPPDAIPCLGAFRTPASGAQDRVEGRRAAPRCSRCQARADIEAYGVQRWLGELTRPHQKSVHTESQRQTQAAGHLDRPSVGEAGGENEARGGTASITRPARVTASPAT